MTKIQLTQTSRPPAGSPRPLLVSVVSGKGGVGKSVVAFNLAERLAALGTRVLVVDADRHCGNIHILANAYPKAGLQHLTAGRLTLDQAALHVGERLDVLASLPADDLPTPQAKQAQEIAHVLRGQGGRYDVVLLDHSSGVSEFTVAMTGSGDAAMLVVVPELTSIADGYGLYKRLLAVAPSLDCRLLLNRVVSAEEADEIRSRFLILTDRFLGTSPGILGSLSDSDDFRQSVARQQPLALVNPDSAVLPELVAVGRTLLGPSAPRGMSPKTTAEKTINHSPETADIRG